MRTELYWIPIPGPGRVAISPRPRGGDWLEDELQSWHQAGIDVVVSLLMPDEIVDLNLMAERELCQVIGIDFHSLPIPDRGIPPSREAFSELLQQLSSRLAEGKNIAIHCRQGIGRAAMLVVCLLIVAGIDLGAAIQQVGSARGCTVPETPDQRRWIEEFAMSLETHLPL